MTNDLDEAIELAANAWRSGVANGRVPSTTNLADRCRAFAHWFLPELWAEHPRLRAANDQVRLLIIAEGLAQSGLIDRRTIERELGIILPPTGR